MDKYQILYDLKQAVIFLSNQTDEQKYLEQITALVDFIYDNFQEADELNPGYYSQKFEIELAKSAEVLLCFLGYPPNKILKKSQAIKTFIFSIVLNKKYKNGRADFLKQIANFYPKEWISLALNDELWCSDLMNLELLSVLNQKRIGGFTKLAQAILQSQENPKSELAKIANKYLNNEPKFKHYREKM